MWYHSIWHPVPSLFHLTKCLQGSSKLLWMAGEQYSNVYVYHTFFIHSSNNRHWMFFLYLGYCGEWCNEHGSSGIPSGYWFCFFWISTQKLYFWLTWYSIFFHVLLYSNLEDILLIRKVTKRSNMQKYI